MIQQLKGGGRRFGVSGETIGTKTISSRGAPCKGNTEIDRQESLITVLLETQGRQVCTDPVAINERNNTFSPQSNRRKGAGGACVCHDISSACQGEREKKSPTPAPTMKGGEVKSRLEVLDIQIKTQTR